MTLAAIPAVYPNLKKVRVIRSRSVRYDVIIVGLNGIEFLHVTNPTLTTVQSDGIALGRTGGQRRYERVRGGEFRARDTIIAVYTKQGCSTQPVDQEQGL